MSASSTVENYLKAIYAGVQSLTRGQRLLPMGQLATSLRVAPGTATTMVKTLAESGLVEYEPYVGVTLTPAGERLAALVLRRHRLVEAFLVKIMGYGWDEVHDEAEQLEHVVSDRLIARMDEMLGRPASDPHGDPIPDSEGAIRRQDLESLLTCPLNREVKVTRVVDQDRAFLQFIESNHLKPGESIEVEERDASSDSVTVRGRNDRRITIGTRAASKLLVEVTAALLLVLSLASSARAQSPGGGATGSSRPWEITDNSYFVEEAFNQDRGVVQNIFSIDRSQAGDWLATFTQEWPAPGQRHQFSYTIPYASVAGEHGAGDVLLNYRLQVLNEQGATPAFSPRISLILPTGNASRGLGNGGVGWQVNLPFSRQFHDVYLQGNAGFTHTPRAQFEGRVVNLFTPQVGGSAIWRMRPMFNVMIEAVAAWQESPQSPARQRIVTASPGFRTGWNTGEKQTIVGLALPIVVSQESVTDVGLLGYFSYELPFSRQP